MAASASQSEVDETVAVAAAANDDAAAGSEADHGNGQPAAAAEVEKETPTDSRPPSPLRKRCETDRMRPVPCNSAPESGCALHPQGDTDTVGSATTTFS